MSVAETCKEQETGVYNQRDDKVALKGPGGEHGFVFFVLWNIDAHLTKNEQIEAMQAKGFRHDRDAKSMILKLYPVDVQRI